MTAPESMPTLYIRPAFATTLLEQGEHPAVASAVLGHSSPAFTMSVYQHVLDSMGAQARSPGNGKPRRLARTAHGRLSREPVAQRAGVVAWPREAVLAAPNKGRRFQRLAPHPVSGSGTGFGQAGLR